MNIDPEMAAGYVMVAVGGFAMGALAGRWMMTEMRAALSAVQLRLSDARTEGDRLKRHVNSSSTAPRRQRPIDRAGVRRQCGGSDRAMPAARARRDRAGRADRGNGGDGAGGRAGASCEPRSKSSQPRSIKHAQAVDDHGAATVAAAVEMGSHPAPVDSPAATAATFATPLHAAGVAMGASVAPVAAAAVAAAPQS